MSEHVEHSRVGGVDLAGRYAEVLCLEAVQPHGVLFVLDGPEMIVTHVSDNAEVLLGISYEELLGHPVGALLQGRELQTACMRAREARDIINRRPRIEVCMREQVHRLSGSVYRSGRFVVLELEPRGSDEAIVSFSDAYRRISELIDRLQTETRVSDMCALAVEEIRSVTGFDRVMACRFDDGERQGEVVAESWKAGMQSMQGRPCPPMGICPQPSANGLLDWVSHIPDATCRPAVLVPPCVTTEASSSNGPLDLSCSSLRSASSLQLAHLRSVGARACMCVPLVMEGKLWGVICCHHGAPKLISGELRAACELLGQVLAWQIAVRERIEYHEQASRARMLNARLIERVSGRARYRDGLLEDTTDLLEIVNASGAAVLCNGDCDVIGKAPPAEDIARIVGWIARHMTGEVFSTRCLGTLHAEARRHAADATGVLAIRLPDSPGSFVLWFRPEVEATALPWQRWEIEVASELREAIVSSLSRRSEDLARANEQLRAASLLRDEFLSTLSHELRTPLNAIIGWAHLLQSGELSEERRAHATDVILRNAHMQTRLVDDLLDISRIVRGNLRLKAQAVDLVEIIEETVRSLETAAAAKAITVQTVLDIHAGPIAGEPGRLQQVVWNLLSNAIKYTPTGGHVQIGLRRSQSSVMIGVEDSGVGIEPDELPYVFERFQRGEVGASRGGLGLGLAIVRSLVELHGGTVEASSEGKGQGACFVVRLPLSPLSADKKSEPEGGNPHPSEPARKRRVSLSELRILVVEDDEDSKELLAEVLRDHGARVTAVDSGNRALSALDRATPDIIISDIGMPGMDGYELIRRVRERPDDDGGRVPAIALTAYVRAQDRSRAFLAGYQAHVPKPLDIGKLLGIILRLTDRASCA